MRNLNVEFDIDGGRARVVRDLGFDVRAGETLAIVGESGCGKSMTALALMGLVPDPPGRVAGGEILLAGENLVTAGERRMQAVRGADISMVFQEPMTSLNPVFTIGEQIAETVRAHKGASRADAWKRAVDMLAQVGIPAPERRAHDYPHQMSGGMRQRVMIAIALACEPRLLIADEPTTALDVTVQAQIFDLFRDLQRETGTAVILITHDIGLVTTSAERVMVMYAGEKVEEGDVADMLRSPRHPYVSGLLACAPRLQAELEARAEPLFEIPGSVPAPRDLSAPGCSFAPRCSLAMEICRSQKPAFKMTGNRGVACWAAEGRS